MRATRLALFALLQLVLVGPALASIFSGNWEPVHFCKCICFSNYTILPLLLPDDPFKPCLTCTKRWCLDQKLPICHDAELGKQNPDTATGREGDVDTRCFQRDSPRDQLVVTLFILIIVGLLIGAAARGKMKDFDIDPADAWEASRKWWESLRIPGSRGEPAIPLSQPRRGLYENVATVDN